MKLVIVQLSDIHLSVRQWPQNPVVGRAKQLLSAVQSLFAESPTGCVLLVNGDVAFAGLESEYELAIPFLKEIRDGLGSIFKQGCHSVLLPGNHDCDFDLDNSARQTLIKDSPLHAFSDGSIPGICTGVQDAFFKFAAHFTVPHGMPSEGMDRLVKEHKLVFGADELIIRVLNSAWCSQKKEKEHSLLMPVDAIRSHFSTPDGVKTVVVTAVHHPYSWMEPTNARTLRNLIESSSDLIFTGHEHVSESYSKTRSLGEHNVYIEAGPLQENGSPDNSEFNVVKVDTEKGEYVVHHFVWNDGMYQTVDESLPRSFVRNNARLQAEFLVSDEFQSVLIDAETPYQHPFKETITLPDIFIYPDLREYTPATHPDKRSKKQEQQRKPQDRGARPGWSEKREDEVASTARRTVRGREFIDNVVGKRLVVVSAPDRSGKTALAKSLFKDLRSNGHIPLLLSADQVDSKVARTIQKHLDRLFSEQYRGGNLQRYWQLPEKERAIIVDDYDKLPNVKVVRETLLEALAKRFGIVVLLGGTSMRFQELLGSENEASLLGDFTHYEMLGFGHKLRSQLIRKWFTLNRAGEIADNEVDRQVSQIERVVSIVLGRDLLPPYPSFILLLLQQVELRRPIDTAAASYGKLYQAFLTDLLNKRKLDVEMGFSYLSELAFSFFTKKTDNFDEQSAIQWHNWYVQEYQNPIDHALYRDELCHTGLLTYKNGLLRFRVKAAFYFFVANYISTHLEATGMTEKVKELAGKLYREDAANIILFLCHLNRDPLVLDEVLANANALMSETPETDLYEDVKFTGELVAKLPDRQIESGSPEKRRQEMLGNRDLAESEDDPSDEMYAYKHEDESDEESEQRRQLAQLNAAIKTIQILGQIARSFAGSLKGNQKKQLATACFSLGLRFLGFAFHIFKMTKDDLGTALQNRLMRRDDKLTQDVALAQANQLIFMIVEMCTYAVISHVAGSIGVERLAMTFKEIKDENSSIGVRMIDAAIQLEHYVNVPEGLLIDLYEDTKDVLLLKAVVQHLAWDRLYYFHCPHDVSARICSKIGIKLLPQTFDRDQKRT